MIRSFLFALLACTACATPSPRSAPTAPLPALAPVAIDPRIADLVAAAQRDHDIVGASVLVAHHGQVMAQGYGLADREHQVAATPDTVYRIGSVTKQFTAVAILQLVERGQLAVTDDLTKYLPDYPVHGITIEHLLTHTSGIANFTDGPEWRELRNKPISRAALVATFSHQPLAFSPGAKFAYSNSNYYLLGLILEHITHQAYADVIRDRLLKPAGMTATAYCADTLPHHAQGYGLHDGQVRPAEPLDMTHPYAAGGLCSTVRDLLAWQRALDAGTVIRPATLARMRSPHPLADGSASPYGYAMFVDALGAHRRFQHGGGINGFAAMLARYPDDDLTVIVLVNREGSAAVQLADHIARATLGVPEPAAASVPAVALDDTQRARYLGAYRLTVAGHHLTATVSNQGSSVHIQLTGQPDIAMRYLGHDTFDIALVKAELAFHPGATPDAAMASFTLTQNGLTIEATRAP